MISQSPVRTFFKHIKFTILLCLLLIIYSLKVSSQLIIHPIQDFNFGTVCHGNAGGTVNISITGSRSATGDILLINTGALSSQAIFEIEAPASSNISIVNGPASILIGSNGGFLSFQLGSSDLGTPFKTTAVPSERTRIQISGTLTVGDVIASPPGNYNGTFSITFNQE